MRKKKVIAIIGYGSQGRAWALNLRDSGCEVIIGIPAKDASRKTAKRDRMRNVFTVSEAVRMADIIVFAFPDHLHAAVYNEKIASNLKAGGTLVFLHGLSVHFGQVIPPDNCDIILLAPLGPGSAVREKYQKKQSIGYFYGIHQDATGKAKQTLKNLIFDMRIDKTALIKTTFADEAIGDLFGEQVVLCGGLTELIKAGHETLVEAGLSSDKAYLEVAYQLDLIINLIKRFGIEGMYKRISMAAKYGSYLNGRRIIDENAKKNMKLILKEIREGTFTNRLSRLTPDRIKKLQSDLKKMTTPALEKSALKFSPEKHRK